MGVDIGQDSKVEALENAPDAGRWYDAVLDIIGMWRSDRNRFGAAALLDAQAVTIPTGAITKWAGSGNPPSGWLKCEGQAVSKADHANLYAKVGDTFGSTATTFNLPDYRRRTSVGAGGSRPAGSSGPGTALGDTGGAETATITVGQMARHTHGLDLSLASAEAHNHKVGETWNRHANDSLNTGRQLVGRTDRLPSTSGATLGSATDAVHTHRLTGNVGNAGSANPSPITITSRTVVVAYIVKT